MSETKVIKALNVYQKLQKCRVELQSEKLKKTGKNKYSNYDYFELGDFLPKANEIMDKHGLASIFRFTPEEATLAIINSEKIDEKIIFTTPVTIAQLKGCYAIQNIGATQTYARRYLYVMAFEISEPDVLDDAEPDEKAIHESKPIDTIRVATIKELIKKTNSNEKAFLQFFKVKKVEDITNGLFTKVMDALEKKQKENEEKEKAQKVDLGI
jgi:hypothetical protein